MAFGRPVLFGSYPQKWYKGGRRGFEGAGGIGASYGHRREGSDAVVLAQIMVTTGKWAADEAAKCARAECEMAAKGRTSGSAGGAVADAAPGERHQLSCGEPSRPGGRGRGPVLLGR